MSPTPFPWVPAGAMARMRRRSCGVGLLGPVGAEAGQREGMVAAGADLLQVPAVAGLVGDVARVGPVRRQFGIGVGGRDGPVPAP